MFPKPKNSRKNAQKKRNFVTKFSKICPEWSKFTYFVDNASKCIPYKFFFGKLQLFLPDSQKSQIHLVYLQNFSISRLKILKKMLNFLSFLVLLYVSGHFKQKKISKFFLTDRKISSPIHLVFPILKLFTTYNFWKIRFH